MKWLVDFLVENTIQCWGCPVFDRLFQIVSSTATSFYGFFSQICFIIFIALFAIYMFNAIYQNARKDFEDTFYKKSLQKVFISSIVVLGILGTGVTFPRFITTITFEPIANTALVYSRSMLQLSEDYIDSKVTYQPIQMPEDGFYRPQLRDTIVNLMKSTIAQFQSYVKMGVSLMSSAFTWKALLGIGALIKHIIWFFVGLSLAWQFLKLYFKYCCYFIDAIIAMGFFAFFFPLSLATFAFKGADYVPKIVEKIGTNVGVNQMKNVINSIVTLASVVITYTIIMIIVAKFFSAQDVSVADIMTIIGSGDIYDMEISFDNAYAFTLTGLLTLMYVLNFLYQQIPQVSQMILSLFNVQESKSMGEQVAGDLKNLGKNAAGYAKKIGAAIMSKGKKDADAPDSSDTSDSSDQ